MLTLQERTEKLLSKSEWFCYVVKPVVIGR